MDEDCPNPHWTMLTNPDGGSTVPVRHVDAETVRRAAERQTRDSFALSDLQQVDQLEYGDVVPGVTCPECGGDLVHTSIGARCDWDQIYVPIVGSAVLVNNEDEPDQTDWESDDDA